MNRHQLHYTGIYSFTPQNPGSKNFRHALGYRIFIIQSETKLSYRTSFYLTNVTNALESNKSRVLKAQLSLDFLFHVHKDLSDSRVNEDGKRC